MSLHWFIGWDPRDDLAAQVAVRSMARHTDADVRVHFLKDHELRRAGVYWRAYEVRPNGQMIDSSDGKPCSTQFSFSRFLVPELARMLEIHEPVLFTDADVMFRSDIAELFKAWDDSKAVMCIQHDHTPKEIVKFDGFEQTRYFRKNWSSVMIMHPNRTKGLTPQKVNAWPGSKLHSLVWAEDKEIGALNPTWNHLAGYDAPREDAKLVHFTLGTPDMPGLERSEHSAEWGNYLMPDEWPEYYPANDNGTMRARGGMA